MTGKPKNLLTSDFCRLLTFSLLKMYVVVSIPACRQAGRPPFFEETDFISCA